MNIFFELHSDLPQEGPGSDESTLRALHAIPNISSRLSILDIGCGPGRQTITLAKHTKGNIIALDNHQPFLDELSRRATVAEVADRIQTVNQSMMEMNFDPGSFDLIWSEGALYIMGFENGLTCCKKFLKPGGFMAVSEIAWLKDSPPEEIKLFFEREYPSIKSIDENKQIITNAGYSLITSFILAESDWWDGYYLPLEKRITMLRKKYADDNDVLDFLDESQLEIDLFRKYSEYYGYVFFVTHL